MKITINSADGNTDANDLVERRLAFALARFADLIQRVDVTLDAVDGPRGGVDQRCLVRVTLNQRRAPITAEVVHSSLPTAIDHAAARAGRSVGRAVDFEKTLRSGQKAIRSTP